MWKTSFLTDDRGNIAILTGLVLLPVFGIAGMAIDYNRAIAAQNQLQQALDSTVLTLAGESARLTDEELNARAAELFEVNFPDYKRYGFDDIAVTRGDGTIELTSSGSVPTTIASLLHVDEIDVGSRSTAIWGSGRIELALVLDNTDSMDRQWKMQTLKEATHDLLNTLEESVYEEDAVKVSIIPFNTQVNIGTGYEDAEWLILPETEDDDGGNQGGGWGGWGGWNGGGWGGGGSNGNGFEWAGCVQDRDKPNDANDAPFDEDDPDRTGYTAVECDDDDLTSILPLTSDFEDLRDKVDDMEPAGYTNITIGIAWGLASLTPQAPLTEATPLDDEDYDELRRAMVILTDGDNTANRWYDYGDRGARSEIDKRTKAACQAVKDHDIIIYTVRVINGNASLLRDCASENSFYYDVQDVDELLPAFQGIARSIARLRLAR